MTHKTFALLLERDGGRCLHCGLEGDTLVPGHRYGRGAGGSRTRNVPSNIVSQCSRFNGLIEQSNQAGTYARAWAGMLGLRLSHGRKPATEPVWDMWRQQWRLLDDQWGWVVILDRPAPTFSSIP